MKYLTNKIATLIKEINKLSETVEELMAKNDNWQKKYTRVKQLYVSKV